MVWQETQEKLSEMMGHTTKMIAKKDAKLQPTTQIVCIILCYCILLQGCGDDRCTNEVLGHQPMSRRVLRGQCIQEYSQV